MTQVTVLTIVPVVIVMVVATACMAYVYWSVRTKTRAANRWSFDHASRRLGIASSRLSPQRQMPAQSSIRAATDASPPAPPRRRMSLLVGGRDGSSRWSRGSLLGGLSRNNASSRTEQAVFWQSIFYLLSFWMTWPLYFVGHAFSRNVYYSYSFSVILVTFCPLQGFFNFLVYARPRLGQVMLQRRRARKKDKRPPSASLTNDTSKNSGNTNAASRGKKGTLPTEPSNSCGFDSVEAEEGKEQPPPCGAAAVEISSAELDVGPAISSRSLDASSLPAPAVVGGVGFDQTAQSSFKTCPALHPQRNQDSLLTQKEPVRTSSIGMYRSALMPM